jgi:negative regulator of flagellin synthesis FlgM
MNGKIDGIGGGVGGSLRVDAQPRRASSAGAPVEAASPSTGLRLSNDSVELRAARELASAEPGFDAAKVEQLRAQVEAGSYTINPQAVAARLMSIEGSLK